MMLPFRTAEDAWLWTMARLVARRDRAKPPEGPPRPCTPDDVVLVLDRLYRQRAISLEHAQALRSWGERGHPPGENVPRARARWDEAMAALDTPLRAKGIVGEAPHA